MKRNHYFTVAWFVLCIFMGASIAQMPTGTLKLPKNVSVELISPEHGTLMFNGAAGDGTFNLPQGTYRLESWTLEKKEHQGHTWKLSGDVNTARTVEVGAETTELAIKTEPIDCDLKIYPGPSSMNFTLGLKGPSGERLRVSGDAPGVKSDQLPQPTFVLCNEDKTYQKSYDFQSQCCGNFRFNWIPPVDVAGPFYLDIKVAGPFKTDFVPRNISDMHQEAIANQQAQHARELKQMFTVGICYIAALLVLVAVLIKFRKSIATAMQKGEGKRPFKRLTILLGVLIFVMLINPLLTLYTGDHEFTEAVAESGLFGVVLLVGVFAVWGIRKVRTKWPFVTLILYGLLFVFVLTPFMMAVFIVIGHPDADFTDVGLEEVGDFYGWMFTFEDGGAVMVWAFALAMLISQASLLIVPVRVKHQRPKARRGIWWTAIIAALLYTALLFFAGLSIMAVIWGDNISEPVFWVLVGILPLNWIGWSIVFCLFSRTMEPESFIRRLMNWLIGGSILELLIAVPSHIIIRHRDVCCAHGLTAAGLTSGLAVIFFAFGPGLYFLYADRIRSTKPNLPDQVEGQEILENESAAQ